MVEHASWLMAIGRVPWAAIAVKGRRKLDGAELVRVTRQALQIPERQAAQEKVSPRVLAVLQQRRQELQGELRQPAAAEVFP